MKKGFFLLAQVLLLVITINICGVEGQCLPTNSTGCLNGVEYSFDTQFACRNEVYNWTTNGCCYEGLVFNSTQSFCCYDGIHDYDQYYCGVWLPITTTENGEEEGDAAKKLKYYENLNTPYDTVEKNSFFDVECTTATTQYGCLNGVQYDWNTEYPCVSWILSFETQGCCVNNYYFLTNQTCCFHDGNYFVRDRGHACQAYEYTK